MTRTASFFVSLGSALVLGTATPVLSIPQAPEPDHLLRKLLEATMTNSHEQFVEDGEAAFKAAMTKQMLGAVSAQLAPRLEAGYKATYLGQLEQQGYEVHLWKLAFEDGGDDILAKMSLKGGKVGGFWLQ